MVFAESREGRAAEIAAWSNGATAVAVALAITVLGWSRLPVHSAWLGLAAGAFTLLVLRLALAHRFTVWFAAVAGTLTIASLGGSIAWVLGHVIETPSAASIAAVVGALLSALAPAWSYSRIAKRRAESVRDSLVDPVSVRSSR
ncbi:MAG: hypothetical protein JWP87_1358 [Labilithrix sp.]|nr:hypothetical protein [Labilithrix sp.]